MESRAAKQARHASQRRHGELEAEDAPIFRGTRSYWDSKTLPGNMGLSQRRSWRINNLSDLIALPACDSATGQGLV